MLMNFAENSLHSMMVRVFVALVLGRLYLCHWIACFSQSFLPSLKKIEHKL